LFLLSAAPPWLVVFVAFILYRSGVGKTLGENVKKDFFPPLKYLSAVG
jgi:hypothetical protein